MKVAERGMNNLDVYKINCIVACAHLCSAISVPVPYTDISMTCLPKALNDDDRDDIDDILPASPREALWFQHSVSLKSQEVER